MSSFEDEASIIQHEIWFFNAYVCDWPVTSRGILFCISSI
jgi:hypothetical protein